MSTLVANGKKRAPRLSNQLLSFLICIGHVPIKKVEQKLVTSLIKSVILEAKVNSKVSSTYINIILYNIPRCVLVFMVELLSAQGFAAARRALAVKGFVFFINKREGAANDPTNKYEIRSSITHTNGSLTASTSVA